jgi:ABC-type branched-subunit amino acid transport system substrate-binding protein
LPVLTKTSRVVAMGLAALVAVGAAACSSTNSSTSTTTAGGGGTSKTSAIPAGAFSDHTGVTSKTVEVANVSTLSAGLFKGAQVGTQAYADYVNSTGGVNGRKLVVNDADDKFTGATNKQATQTAIDNDFAMVGNFSLEDNFGGALLKTDPGMPDVSVVLDPATNKLPNVFSPVPLNAGWEEGPFQYLKQKFPADLHAAGAMVGAFPSAEADWAGQKSVLEKVGFKVIYDPTYTVSTTDFTQNVIAMKNAGVKILFLEGMSETYAASLLKDLVQQNYRPDVVLGSATYTDTVAKDAGGAGAIDGDYLEMNTSLYLGQDASAVPAVGTFLHWVNVASPGFQPDLYTMYAWISAELFTQALKHAGSDPSRGSELQALSRITSFDGDHLIAPTDPAAKTIGNCYLIARVVNGTFVRQDDPPVDGPTHGYRCDYSYINPPSG